MISMFRVMSRVTWLWLAIALVACFTGAGLFFLLGAQPAATGATSTTGLAREGNSCSSNAFLGDSRFGPATVPNQGVIGAELIGYDPTGGETRQAILGKFYNTTAKKWDYPPKYGYQIKSGKPIEWQQELVPGQYIDRYGNETHGFFLSPTGLSYSSRAIPPDNLESTPAAGCNYHNYKVAKSFSVDAGPVAAWFGQPGGGLQYQLDSLLVQGAPAGPKPRETIDVNWMVDSGFLVRA